MVNWRYTSFVSLAFTCYEVPYRMQFVPILRHSLVWNATLEAPCEWCRLKKARLFSIPVSERALLEKRSNDVSKTKFLKLWDRLLKMKNDHLREMSLLVQIGEKIYTPLCSDDSMHIYISILLRINRPTW